MKLRPPRRHATDTPPTPAPDSSSSQLPPPDPETGAERSAVARGDAENGRPDARPSRVMVEAVAPVVDAGAFAAKASLELTLTVVADVFTDGHDVVFAELDLHPPGDGSTVSIPMTSSGNDRFTASVVPDRLGRWTYDVTGWVSHAETWRRGTVLKTEAGLDTTVEAEIGRLLVQRTLDEANDAADDVDITMLRRLRDRLADGDVSTLDDPDLTGVFFRAEPRDQPARFPAPLPIDVDPKLATVGAWYSFFPRSTVRSASDADIEDATDRAPATLRDAIGRLDYIADMGFDVVYIPPVHPIGTTNRKGRNNATIAEPGDVGSPYAIGSSDGGHFDVAPELGTIEDVTALADGCRARRHGAGPRHRVQLLTRPSVGDVASRLVRHPPRRHDPVRREPSEEVRGHLPARLRDVRLAGALAGVGRRVPLLDRPRRHRLPRRQPSYQGVRVLGVGDLVDPPRPPRRDLPLRSVHTTEGDATPRQTRLQPVVHLLRLA